MNFRPHPAVVLGLVLSGSGCGDPHADEGEVCVVPLDCTCDSEHFACGDYCPEGAYPVNTGFSLVYGIPASSAEIHFEDCTVEQTGEFELTVHTSWREQSTEDNLVTTWLDCDDKTPKLAPGTWTIHYGSGSGKLVIPTELRGTICVSAQ